MTSDHVQNHPLAIPADHQDNTSGVASLLQAMMEGKVQLARFLLVALGEGAVNAPLEEAEGGTLLMHAALLPRQAERAQILQLLLARGAEVDAQNRAGRTALSLASERGYLDVVKLLVLHGANPDTPDLRGCTPLVYAARSRHGAVIKLLLKELKGQEKEPAGVEQAGEEVKLLGSGGGPDRNPIKHHPRLTRQGVPRPDTATPSEAKESHCLPLLAGFCAFPEGLGPYLSNNCPGDMLLGGHVICNPYAVEEDDASRPEVDSSLCWPSLGTQLLQPLTESIIQSPEKQEKQLSPSPNLENERSMQTSRSGFLQGWLKRGHPLPCPPDPSLHGLPKPSSGLRKWTSTWKALQLTAQDPIIPSAHDPAGDADTDPDPAPSCISLSSCSTHAPIRPPTLKSKLSAADPPSILHCTVFRNRSFREEGPQRGPPCLQPVTVGGEKQHKGVSHPAKRSSLPSPVWGGTGGGSPPAPPHSHRGSWSSTFCMPRRHTSPELGALPRLEGAREDKV